MNKFVRLGAKETAMADETRSRLGRGLASLIGDVGGEAAQTERPGRAQRRVPIEFLKANPHNPRRAFSEVELAELAESIRQHGVIQPIVVRAVKGTADRYEIVAGERRWRASQLAKLREVPIVTIEVSDSAALEIAIIENVQRADLNAIEEAQGYHALAAEFKRSQDDIAKIVGKSRSHVANMMRLTKLPDAVQAHVVSGRLTAGHARALIGFKDAIAAANVIIKEDMTVRQTEAMVQDSLADDESVKGSRGKSGQTTKTGKAKDADTRALEKRVGDILGLKVSVEHRDPGGTMEIAYRDLEQLDEVLRRLEKGR